MSQERFWSLMGFVLAVYLVMLSITVFGHSFAHGVAKQMIANFLPVYDGSLLKNVLVMTGTYWGIATMYILILVNTQKSDPKQP